MSLLRGSIFNLVSDYLFENVKVLSLYIDALLPTQLEVIHVLYEARLVLETGHFKVFVHEETFLVAGGATDALWIDLNRSVSRLLISNDISSSSF